MSLKTWTKEFYPTPASLATKRTALAHSLRKWEGLLKKNVRRHGGMVVSWGDVSFKDGVFLPDGSNCSLCRVYDVDGMCSGCPIDSAGQNCHESGSAFPRYIETGNAVPMVNLLRRLNKAAKK